MSLRNDIWTYVIVTGVSLIIWFWAAGETRDETEVYATVKFTVTGDGKWRISPEPQVAVTLRVAGSKLALADASRELARNPLPLELLAEVTTRTVDLASRLPEMVEQYGVSLVSVEPASVSIEQDEIRLYDALVVPVLPGVQTEGDIEVSPPDSMVWLPSRRRAQLPADLVIEAFVDQSRLQTLEPGVEHTLSTPLRVPGIAADLVEFEETKTADLKFTVASSIREMVLDSVRVHVAGPHEDFVEYGIEIAEPVLRNVTIRGDAEVVRRIQDGEANVVAMVHLSNRDKENEITEKKVAYFLALAADTWTDGVNVEGTVDGTTGMPVVQLKITRHDATEGGQD